MQSIYSSYSLLFEGPDTLEIIRRNRPISSAWKGHCLSPQYVTGLYDEDQNSEADIQEQKFFFCRS